MSCYELLSRAIKYFATEVTEDAEDFSKTTIKLAVLCVLCVLGGIMKITMMCSS